MVAQTIHLDTAETPAGVRLKLEEFLPHRLAVLASLRIGPVRNESASVG